MQKIHSPPSALAEIDQNSATTEGHVADDLTTAVAFDSS